MVVISEPKGAPLSATRKPAGPSITIETITPKKAIEYLEPNRENRKVRQDRVDRYAREMEKGHWMMSGDPIRFGGDGRLLDGQHRLLAVVKCNKPVEFVVIRDLQDDVFRILDSGLVRNNGDALGFNVKSSIKKAATCRVLWVTEAGGDPRLSTDLALVDKIDLSDYYNLHQGAVDAAVNVSTRIRSQFRSANETGWCALIVLGWRSQPSLMNTFVETIRSGANMGYGDPRLALRNWLSNDRQLRNAGEHLALYIKSWNAWLEGEKRQLASIRPDEPFPVMLTEPKRPMDEVDVLAEANA